MRQTASCPFQESVFPGFPGLTALCLPFLLGALVLFLELYPQLPSILRD